MPDTSFIYSIFANDENNRLNSLKDEYVYLWDLLWDREEIKYVPLEYASSERLRKNIVRYNKEINIFHFAGHANGQAIKLESEGEIVDEFDVASLKGYLENGYCENLKLVFLNACNTHDLGIELIKVGVPAVIVTYGKVNDDVAKDIATEFYRGLWENKDKSLRELLKDLEKYLKVTKNEQVSVSGYRSDDIFEFEEEVKVLSEDQPLWGILYNEQEAAKLDDFVPLPLDLPEDILDLPDEPEPEVTTPIVVPDAHLEFIKEGFFWFNYRQQKRAINNHLGANPLGAFFAYGGRHSGINWFCHNLMGEVRHIRNAPNIENIVFSDNLDSVESLTNEMLHVLNLSVAPEKDKLEALAEGIFKVLQSHSILLRLYDEFNIAKEILPDIRAKLWNPLSNLLRQKIDTFNSGSAQPLSFHKLLLLFIDDRIHEVGDLGQEAPLILPPIEDVNETEFERWKDMCLDFHGNMPWGNLFQQESLLLNEKKPYRMLQKAAELLGYEFSGGPRNCFELKRASN